MHSLQFWKSWSAQYQRLWWVIAAVFAASLALAFFAFIQNPAPVFTWQQLQDLQQQEIPVYAFEVAGFEMTVSAENFILFERWLGNPLQISMTPVDVYGILFAAGLVTLLAILTTLSRFWFYAGAGAVVFMITNFQLEVLELFGLQNKLPTIGLTVIILGAGLYFQFIKQAASFPQRLIVFLVIALAFGFIIARFSTVPQPLRYFAINTMPVSAVLLVVFTIMVAHEIIASFVTLVGKGTQNSKSLRHFLIISFVYLITLWLAYWNKIGWIDWGYTVHPFVLLAVSGTLSIWGIRQRAPQYENIIAADPFAVYFILALGTISFSVAGYFLASANDTAILSLNDIVIYTHIGYGMIFLMYVASNFLNMLASNFQVYRVLYKPTVMPYVSYRIAGLIFTLAFIFYRSWMVPVNHFISSYNTALGDMFYAGGNTRFATGYYKRAHFYASYNQHASTALARLEAENEKLVNERNYLYDAIQYQPSAYSLLNYADSYHRSGKRVEELLSLQDAYEKLPKSGIIQNNLGLSFAQVGLHDSAFYYFFKASKNAETSASAEMNLLGLMARSSNIKVNPDSIREIIETDEPRVKSNALALANHQGKMIDVTVDLPKDSLFDIFSAAYLGNYLTNHITNPDTALLTACIKMARKKENQPYKGTILAPAAKACYSSGQVNRAFQLLQEIIFLGSNEGTNNHILALWALDQGQPEAALSFLPYAFNQKARDAGLTNAIAIAEAGRLNEAIVAWDSLHHSKDTLVRTMAESMTRVLGGPESWFKEMSEKEKYQFIHYRVALADSLHFDQLLDQITNEDMKARTILDRARKWFDVDEPVKATHTFQKLQGLHLTDTQLFGKIKYFELQLFATSGKVELLQAEVDKGVLLGPYHATERVYYEALKQISSGDSLNAARNLNWLGSNNSFFDEGVVASANFFKHDNRKSYLILSEALQINPHSVKILKAYIPVAIARGYDQYANGALQTLQSLMPPASFKLYSNSIVR